jgi:hypothetical protein
LFVRLHALADDEVLLMQTKSYLYTPLYLKQTHPCHYLSAKREGYKEGTEYNFKGISAFLEEEAERFPDVME